MGPNSSKIYDQEFNKDRDLTPLQPHLEDYFNIIIWDSLDQIICEFPSDYETKKFKQMKQNIRSLFVDSVISLENDFSTERKLEVILDEFEIKTDLIRQYLIETFDILRRQLLEMIEPRKEDDRAKIEDLIDSIENTVREYTLTSYFDKIILSQAIKPLLYTTSVSYAEINEFRLHLIEIFDEALHDKIKISQIKDYLDEKLNGMSENRIINSLVISIIIGFLSTLAYHQDYTTLINEMKFKVEDMVTVAGDLTFLESDSTTTILKWISYDIIDPILNMLESDETWIVIEELDIFKTQILNLFEMQLNRKLALKSVLDELKKLEKEYKSKAKKLGKKTKIRKHKAKYVDLGSQRFMIESNQQRTSFFFMILEFLATHLDEQLEEDFQLTKITESIRAKEYKSFDQFYL